MNKHNTFSILLSLLMSLVASVANAHDFGVDGIYYGITSSTEPYTASVTYWSDDYYFSNTYTGSVTIPESVTYNGKTYSVTSIGKYAFEDCSGLTSVTIPNSVTVIGEHAFFGCSGLTAVYISDLAAWCGIWFWDKSSNPLSNAHHLYLNGEEVKDLEIPASVTSIGSYAFYDCRDLTSVTIPNSVTEIGSWAFFGCSGLTSVTIPESVTKIGGYAFGSCSGIRRFVSLTSNVSIGTSCFHGIICNILVPLGSENSYSDKGASVVGGFYTGNVFYVAESRNKCSVCWGTGEDINIPAEVEYNGNRYEVSSIWEYAFEGCTGLTSVTIGNSVTSIGNYAFNGCSGLTSVTIPNSVTSIGEGAFYGTAWYNNQPDGLVYAGKVAYKYKGTMPEGTSIVLEEGTLGITSSAFRDCSGLTSVEIPESVTSIGNYAFADCFGLTSVTIPASVTSIGKGAFMGCKLRNVAVKSASPPSSSEYSFSEQTQYHTTLYIPMGTWDAYAYDDAWYKFINIRETASEQHEIVADMAYTLMDAKTFSYAVYDPVNDRVRMVASVNVDESDLNHCWQTVEVSGKKFLYNIGAKKFAVPSTDGSIFRLSSEVGSIAMEDGDKGIVIGGNTAQQWALVVDEKIDAYLGLEDVVATGVLPIDNGQLTMDNAEGVYDLSGRRINVNDNVNVNNSKFEIQNSKLKRGIYIVNGKKLLKR